MLFHPLFLDFHHIQFYELVLVIVFHASGDCWQRSSYGVGMEFGWEVLGYITVFFSLQCVVSIKQVLVLYGLL